MIYIVDIEDESEIKFSDCTNLPKWRSTLIVWAVLSEYINPHPPPPPPPKVELCSPRQSLKTKCWYILFPIAI